MNNLKNESKELFEVKTIVPESIKKYLDLQI